MKITSPRTKQELRDIADQHDFEKVHIHIVALEKAERGAKRLHDLRQAVSRLRAVATTIRTGAADELARPEYFEPFSQAIELLSKEIDQWERLYL